MNGFQVLAFVALGAALARDLLGWRHARPHPLRAIRVAVWCAALVAIANPLWVTRAANALGIGRGADIVLYVLALAFVLVSFFLYAQNLRLHRALSEIASQLALRDAHRGGPPSPRASDTVSP